MKYRVGIIVCMLIIGTISLAGAYNFDKNDSNFKSLGNLNRSDRFVLITNSNSDTVWLVDNSGSILWQKSGLAEPVDAELLPNGNVLIVEMDGDRVIEVDTTGSVIWEDTSFDAPMDIERLSNGNTLITESTESGSGRVVELDSSGTIVWQKAVSGYPFDAERLDNGNTLIVQMQSNRVFEVDPSGTTVWSKTGLQMPSDAERLSNGNTLIADYLNYRVIEVNSGGSIVWSITGLDGPPTDAERLSNGNTLITLASGSVIEVNSGGSTVWHKTGCAGPFDADGFLNNPPDAPSIDGQTNGETGVEYDYTVVTDDIDGDNVYYWVEWGDNTNSGWEGPYASDEEVVLSHSWAIQGDYTIEVISKDIFGSESDWTTLEVTMPLNQQSYSYPFLELFRERFPIIYELMMKIIGGLRI